MKDFIKRTRSALFNMFPWQLKYIIDFKLIKNRWPRLYGKMDYSDYIFKDNLLGRHNKHAYLADKYAVRDFVESKGLGHILTKLYGVWDDASKIDFSKLPVQFAMKCNHSCGMNIICYNRKNLDEALTRKQLNEWLHTPHTVYFERHYKLIKPLVICEEIIPSDKDGFFPMDYKIHCANGKPVFIQCCLDRTEESVGKRVIYSPEWIKLPYIVHDDHYVDVNLPRPDNLDDMLGVATILSEGLEYARIDLYEVEGRIIFGEITLTPMGGWLSYFTPESLDIMGKKIRKQS